MSNDRPALRREELRSCQKICPIPHYCYYSILFYLFLPALYRLFCKNEPENAVAKQLLTRLAGYFR